MPVNLKKKFALDTQRIIEGSRLDLGDGAFFMVARWGNKEHVAIQDKLREPYKDRLELGGRLTDEEAEDITVKGMAAAILVGWGGITGIVEGSDEKEVPYSVAMAETLLRDKEFEDLRARVFNFSVKGANYLKAAAKVTEKNSSASSNGKRASART